MVAQLDSPYIRTRPSKVYTRLISYTLFEGRPRTTRGRWINGSLKYLQQLLFKRYSGRRVENPIFIIGTGRSGTTILSKILSMHKDVGWLNEPKLLWFSVNAVDDIIGNYTSQFGSVNLDESHASREVENRAHALYSSYLALSRSKVVLDKYPEMIFRIAYLKKLFPLGRFIFITRHYASVASSISKWNQQFSRQDRHQHEDWWGLNDRKWKLYLSQIIPFDRGLADLSGELESLTDHTSRALVEWYLSMRAGIQALERHNAKDIITIRYEDLLTDPIEQLNEILGFCNLSPDPLLLEYASRILKRNVGAVELKPPKWIAPLLDETAMELGY